MKRKKYFQIPAGILLALLLAGTDQSFVRARGGETELPPLIQTTTPESDYRAAAALELTRTRELDEEDARQAFGNVLCSCVRIQVRGHYGSGSIYRMLENEIIVVTNSHVLQFWDEDSYVTFFDAVFHEKDFRRELSRKGEVIGISDTADVGFISVPVSDFSWEELLRLRNIRDRREPVGEGLGLFIPDTATDPSHPVMVEGEVLSPLVYLEDFQAEMLYGKGEAVPGMSGSGVFDRWGNYLGMLSGGTLSEEIAAVPAQTIYDEYLRICFQR